MIAAILGVLLLAMIITYLCCAAKTILVEGNDKYSDEKVKQLVIPAGWQRNTMYQFLKTTLTGMPELAFFDMVNVEIVSHDTLLIQVYEKKMVGCAERNGSYVCFDRDGIVVEVASEPKVDVPFVEGLKFEEPQLYQVLQVNDQNVFNTLVTLSQFLEKSELSPDRICFMDDQTVELMFGEVQVKLGKDEYLANKIARLKVIMGVLEGRSGVLDMSNVTENTKDISFLKTLSEEERQAQEAEHDDDGEDSAADDWDSDEDGSTDDWDDGEDSATDDWDSGEDGSTDDWDSGEDSVTDDWDGSGEDTAADDGSDEEAE